MPTYLYKLIPPRPTFPSDVSAAEGTAMEQHFGYSGDPAVTAKLGFTFDLHEMPNAVVKGADA